MNGGPVEDYLARLRAGLRTPPARTAEIIAEAEDHLRESAAVRQADGLDQESAELAAVAAFGPVKLVIGAHRPTLSAYAAAAGMRAWPLFGCYLLLSALLGGLWIWREIAVFRGVLAPVTWHGTTFLLSGRPDAVQLAATLGGCALAGLAVITAFLVVPRRRRFGAVSVPLPRGLFPLAAGIMLLCLAVAQEQGVRSYGFGWLPRVSGLYELTSGGCVAAAALLGACCVLRALVILPGAAVPPREAAVAGLGVMLSGPSLAGETAHPGEAVPAGCGELTGGGHRPTAGSFVPARSGARAGRIPISAYTQEAALKAGQWLGSFLLLSALIAGVLLYVENQNIISARRELAVWEAACAGYGLAGALLFARVIRARHRREASQARVTLPRWLTLRSTAASLAVIAVAEYWIIASNANGRLATAEAGEAAWQGLYWVAIGAQFAAMLMGAGALGRWILAGWRAAGRSARLDSAGPI